MQFRIADTFTASLGRLPNEQQRAAKTAAFDLQTNPSQPGLGVHKLSNTRGPGFWSARVNLDVQPAVRGLHQGEGRLLVSRVKPASESLDDLRCRRLDKPDADRTCRKEMVHNPGRWWPPARRESSNNDLYRNSRRGA